MGGIIVIDFIDLLSNENKQALFEKMKESMSEDSTKHNILPLSRFGLMQITRQRVRPEMHITTDEDCPVCTGSGKVGPTILHTDKIEDDLKFIVDKVKTRKFILRTHPFVAAYLTKGLFSEARRMSKKHKCSVSVQSIPSYQILEHKFFDSEGDEIDLR
jgi:ribonuclease G